MPIKFFITGTDTDAGKTYVSVSLLKAFHALKLKTLGIKPIASGGRFSSQGLISEDALALQNAANVKTAYEHINPFVFLPPIAPHLAAEEKNQRLSVSALLEKLKPTYQYPADIFLHEGAGGWYTPLNEKETMADFVRTANLPTVLVVGLRLGCINHALLTAKALLANNIKVIGWIGNQIDPHLQKKEENLASLKNYLPFPHLATLARDEEIEKETAELILNWFLQN